MYRILVVKRRMLYVRDNFLLLSENEAGMEPKTVVTYIPLNFLVPIYGSTVHTVKIL